MKMMTQFIGTYIHWCLDPDWLTVLKGPKYSGLVVSILIQLYIQLHIEGLMQNCGNSSALAME